MAKAKARELAASGWTSTDTMVIGIAAGVGVVAALVAQLGGLPRVQALVGLALVFTIAYLSSTARRAIDWRTVGWGISLQILFALIVLKTSIGRQMLPGPCGAQERKPSLCSSRRHRPWPPKRWKTPRAIAMDACYRATKWARTPTSSPSNHRHSMHAASIAPNPSRAT